MEDPVLRAVDAKVKKIEKKRMLPSGARRAVLLPLEAPPREGMLTADSPTW